MYTLRKSVTSVVKHLYSRRSFLSNAYKCEEVWQERLNCSILKKVEPEALYYKLSSLLENDVKQINAIDLDIFANALNDSTYLDELDDLTHKFRLSAQSGTLLQSTHHAVIRLFLKFNKNELIRILKDKLNYGIFPDDYLNNLLMDSFLKENDFRNAAKIASNQMLQEEFNNDIMKSMSLYSCLKYITNPTEWEEVKVTKNEEIQNSDDEEETRIRVDFIRNPYFDDHFDLNEADHLIGKTLLALSKNNNSVMKNSIKTIGLAYYNKWNTLSDFLKKIEGPVYSETVELGLASIDKRKPQNAEELSNLLKKLRLNNRSIIDEAENAVKESVKQNEEKEIQLQKKIYKDWEVFRPEELNRQLEHINKIKRLQKVQSIKEELRNKEQVLFFFDKESKYDLIKEEKMKRMKNNVTKTKNLREDLTYIPPEIRQPGFKRE
ncbi:uncharacterized protein LOC126902269 [Daktulosphaira vitifoliae]|uniref:uncharacterized protein LOC126902269 n=1 Tax=Daktulosphaira vitifoliae TaxID=58002 RepID=UPI0021A9EE09|nr:uncharacterized protein LOC126902269 [Daktulosphaira vitifoliae]